MALDMNPEIREQWCKALRSGEYTQGQNTLRIRKEDDTYSYCCLGVLTDLYVKAGNPEEYQVHGDLKIFHVWDEDVLPAPVKEWAGLDAINPVLVDTDKTYEARASEWNDEEDANFQRIADMIDGGPAKQD